MGRQIVVDVVGDSTKFNKATQSAITNAGTLTGKLQGIGKGMVIGAGIGAFNLLTTAISMGVSALGDAHEAFLQDEQSQTRLATALKNNIPNWNGNTAGAEAFASGVAKLGFTDDETRDSLGKLVGITHDLTEAQNLSSMAMDLARAKNISLEQATSIVTKAAQGNGKALKSLGIDVTGVKDAAGFLDAIQKNVAGSAEKWANTNSGKLAVSNVKVGEAMEKVGGIVDKVSQVAIPILADALEAAVNAFSAVAKAVEPVIRTVGTALTPVIQKLGPLFNQTFNSIKQIVTSVVAVLGHIWDVWGKDIMNVISIAFNYVAGTIRNVMNVISGIIKVITSAIKGDWTGVWNGIKQIIGGVWDQIKLVVSTGLTFLRNTISTVLNAIKSVVGTIWNGIVSAVTTAVGTLVRNVETAWNTLVNFLRGIPARIGGALGSMWNAIWQGFRSVINSVIRGWNSLRFTVPSVDLGPLGTVGGFTIGTPNIPYLHRGGRVPGVPGADVPAILQAGEMVISRQSSDVGPAVVVNIGVMYGGPAGLDQLADQLALRLRLTGATRSTGLRTR